MKLLHATFWEFPHIGGISTHLELLGRGLAHLGNTVHIFSMSLAREAANYEDPEIGRRIKDVLGRQNVSNGYKGFEVNSVLYESAASRIYFNQFDILHAHDVVAAEILGRISGRAVVMTVHGYLANEYVSEKVIEKNSLEEARLHSIEEDSLRHCRHVIAVDNKIGRYIENISGREVNITVLKNFVDISAFCSGYTKEEIRSRLNIPPDTFLVVCPRRLVKKNGVIYGVKAMAQVLKAVPGALFICFGDGPEYKDIYSFILGNKLEKNCILAGSVQNQAVLLYIQAADVVLVPSVPSEGVEEATSIAAIEGMAAGKVVVASNIGGLRELIRDGETGLLVEPFDVGQIACALTEIARNRDKAAIIGGRAGKYALRSHSHIASARKVERIYKMPVLF